MAKRTNEPPSAVYAILCLFFSISQNERHEFEISITHRKVFTTFGKRAFLFYLASNGSAVIRALDFRSYV
jgi:hypothetical protein